MKSNQLIKKTMPSLLLAVGFMSNIVYAQNQANQVISSNWKDGKNVVEFPSLDRSYFDEPAIINIEQLNLIEDISGHISSINSDVTRMTDERRTANLLEDFEQKAHDYCNKVKPLFDSIRYHCDKLELLVDDEIWPMTKYRELLFTN